MIYAGNMAGRIKYLAAGMMRMSKALLLMLMCLCALNTQGAGTNIYYVATNGADSNPGTLAQPWRHIQKAASTAPPGSKVIVGAGEYNEYVSNQVSGTADNPIEFEGQRGTNGEWLTIIDPSTTISNGWVAAPEIGSGVWKQTNMLFATRELTIDYKRVAFVFTNGYLDAKGAASGAFRNSGLTNGTQFLTLPADAVLTNGQTLQAVAFWDGVGALYGTANHPTYTTYLRLRNGDSPNGMNIRAAPNYNDYVLYGYNTPAISIQGRSNIVWRNFMVRGASSGFQVKNQDYPKIPSYNIVIESNYISGGWAGVLIGPIAPSAGKNIVRYNEITENYYGYGNPGAWGAGTDSVSVVRAELYCISKFLMGNGSSYRTCVFLNDAWHSNVISGNHIFKSLGTGIDIFNSGLTLNTEIFNNTIENHTSTGFLLQRGESGTAIYNNFISDCNINLRFHNLDAGDTNRVVYIYRNKLWLPNGIGDHIYASFYGIPATCFPEFWTYHNSFSGGRDVLNISSFAYTSGGLPGCRFLNNIFSGSEYYHVSSVAFATNVTMLGAFDYNLLTPPYPTYPVAALPAWFRAHNIRLQAAEWENTVGISFTVNAGSAAINAAIDVSQPFVIDGVAYPALPGAGEKRDGSAWDIGALEYVAAGPSPLQPASGLQTLP